MTIKATTIGKDHSELMKLAENCRCGAKVARIQDHNGLDVVLELERRVYRVFIATHEGGGLAAKSFLSAVRCHPGSFPAHVCDDGEEQAGLRFAVAEV